MFWFTVRPPFGSIWEPLVRATALMDGGLIGQPLNVLRLLVEHQYRLGGEFLGVLVSVVAAEQQFP